MERSYPYPKPNHTLLKPDGTKVLYSSWISGNWAGYADAYKQAADRLVDQIEGMPFDDRFICPIVFMCRHFIELKLKELTFHLEGLSGQPIPTDKRNRSATDKHELPELWEYVKTNLTCLKTGELAQDIQNKMTQFITEIANLDPDSMHFRYSHTKNDKEMDMPHSLDMDNFKMVMAGIENVLGEIEEGVLLEREGRAIDREVDREMATYLDC